MQQRLGGAAERHHVQQSVSRQRGAALLAALAGAPRAVDPQRVHRNQRYVRTAIVVVVASVLIEGGLGSAVVTSSGGGVKAPPRPDRCPSG